jgi:hypothetical protein
VIAEFFGGIFDLEEDATGAFEKHFAGFGEDGFAAEAVEKLTPHLVFEVYYLLAE